MPLRGQKPLRPKIVSSAGSSVRPASMPAEDPDRGDRAQRRGELCVGQGQREHRERDGQPRGKDRRAGTGDGALHRVVLVLDPVELLAYLETSSRQ